MFSTKVNVLSVEGGHVSLRHTRNVLARSFVFVFLGGFFGDSFVPNSSESAAK